MYFLFIAPIPAVGLLTVLVFVLVRSFGRGKWVKGTTFGHVRSWRDQVEGGGHRELGGKYAFLVA